MKKLKLEFRAKVLPSEIDEDTKDGYYYQKDQYLSSFLRRVLLFYNCNHPSQMSEEVENLLEINIDGEWVKCE